MFRVCFVVSIMEFIFPSHVVKIIRINIKTLNFGGINNSLMMRTLLTDLVVAVKCDDDARSDGRRARVWNGFCSGSNEHEIYLATRRMTKPSS